MPANSHRTAQCNRVELQPSAREIIGAAALHSCSQVSVVIHQPAACRRLASARKGEGARAWLVGEVVANQCTLTAIVGGRTFTGESLPVDDGGGYLTTSLPTLATRMTDVGILAKFVENKTAKANLRQVGTSKAASHVGGALDGCRPLNPTTSSYYPAPVRASSCRGARTQAQGRPFNVPGDLPVMAAR